MYDDETHIGAKILLSALPAFHHNHQLLTRNNNAAYYLQSSPRPLADGFAALSVAAFDLDDTLLNGDSDSSWRVFLVEEGLVDAALADRRGAEFERDYHAGRLNPRDWTRFALQPLAGMPRDELTLLQQEFRHRHLVPMVTAAAKELLAKHRAQGDVIVIITGTNRFVSEPAAALFGVEHLLATEPEWRDGTLSGRMQGTPCYGAGKKEHLLRWAQEQGQSLENLCFYSDSINDRPLLEFCARPVAVNPDPELQRVARENDWPVLQLHKR